MIILFSLSGNTGGLSLISVTSTSTWNTCSGGPRSPPDGCCTPRSARTALPSRSRNSQTKYCHSADLPQKIPAAFGRHQGRRGTSSPAPGSEVLGDAAHEGAVFCLLGNRVMDSANSPTPRLQGTEERAAKAELLGLLSRKTAWYTQKPSEISEVYRLPYFKCPSDLILRPSIAGGFAEVFHYLPISPRRKERRRFLRGIVFSEERHHAHECVSVITTQFIISVAVGDLFFLLAFHDIFHCK